MINAESVKSLKLKELGELASSLNLTGWSRLSKSQLRDFILANANQTSAEGNGSSQDSPQEEPKPAKKPRKRRASKTQQETLFDLAAEPKTTPEPEAKAAAPESTPPEPTPESAPKAEAEAAAPESTPETSQEEGAATRRKRASRKSAKKSAKAEAVPDAAPGVATEAAPVASPVSTSAETPATDATEPEPAPIAKKPRKPRKSRKNAESAPTPASEPTPSVEAQPEASVEAQAEEKPNDTAEVKAEENAVEKPTRRKRAKAKKAADAAQPSVESGEATTTDAQAESDAPAKASEATDAPVKKTPKKRGRKPSKATTDATETPASTQPALAQPAPEVATKDDAASTGDEAEGEAKTEPKRRRRARKSDAAKKDDADTSKEPPRSEPAPNDVKKDVASKVGASADAGDQDDANKDADKKKSAERIFDRASAREREKTDRISLAVCDPYWLRACWETTTQLVERVRSAMGRRWHASSLALRLFEVDREQQSAAVRRTRVEDVVVKREVDNWYVQVDNPPRAFMVELGFLSRDGEFFTLVSSNTVETPQRFIHDPFSRPVFGEPGIYDQRFYLGAGDFASRGLAPRRRSNSLDLDLSAIDRPASARFNSDDLVESASVSGLQISVDAEIIVKGKTLRGARVSVKDKPIRVNRDGEFFARFTLPERRHVFPVVATAPDDSESQTVILAVDRNTKTLDPVYKEDEE